MKIENDDVLSGKAFSRQISKAFEQLKKIDVLATTKKLEALLSNEVRKGHPFLNDETIENVAVWISQIKMRKEQFVDLKDLNDFLEETHLNVKRFLTKEMLRDNVVFKD